MWPTFVMFPIVVFTFLKTIFKSISPAYHVHAAYAVTVGYLFLPELAKCISYRLGNFMTPNMKLETELNINYMVLSLVYLYQVNPKINVMNMIMYTIIIFHEVFNNYENNFIHSSMFIINMIAHIQYFVGFIAPFWMNGARFAWRICTYAQWVLFSLLVFSDVYYFIVEWYEVVCLVLMPLAIPSDSYLDVTETQLDAGITSLFLYDFSPKETIYLLADIGLDIDEIVTKVKKDRMLKQIGNVEEDNEPRPASIIQHVKI